MSHVGYQLSAGQRALVRYHAARQRFADEAFPFEYFLDQELASDAAEKEAQLQADRRFVESVSRRSRPPSPPGYETPVRSYYGPRSKQYSQLDEALLRAPLRPGDYPQRTQRASSSQLRLSEPYSSFSVCDTPQ